MKHSILLIAALLFSCCVSAQDAMTILQFEDAEKAFNNGDYAEAIKKIDEVESKIGVTSKTLYLRIITQDKLIESDMRKNFELIEVLEDYTNKYLEALKNQEVDDRYRNVYEIRKKIKTYLKSKSEIKTNLSSDEYTLKISYDSEAAVGDVISKFWEAIGGNRSPDISSISITTKSEMGASVGTLVSTIKVGIDKYYNEVSSKGDPISKYVYKNNKGYIWVKAPGSKSKNRLTDEEIRSIKPTVQDGKSILERAYASFSLLVPSIFEDLEVKVKEAVINGNTVYIIERDMFTYYFDKESALLIGSSSSYSNTNTKAMSINWQGDYRVVDGILFPFTITTKSFFETVENRSREEEKDSEIVTAINFFSSFNKNGSKQGGLAQHSDEGITTKEIINIAINEPIPDEIFK